MVRILLLLALALPGLLGCAGPRQADVSGFDAEGVLVRHLRVRVAPSHTKDFEALVARCKAAAQDAGLGDEHSWLCYRESPGRYWLLWFGQDELAIPTGRDGLRAFAEHFGRAGDGAALDDIAARLERLEVHQEWNVLHRQHGPWSTVESMSTRTHPMARMMVRSVRPGHEQAFHDALTARTSFLAQRGYPLPIEGFVTLAGSPGTALQVVFPTDWVSFHGTHSFGAFVKALSAEDQAAYADVKARLMETMSRAEFYDGEVLPELSF